MTDNAFDAAGFIEVNLESGTIHTPSHKDMALIPFDLFRAIPATHALKEIATEWGKTRGKVFVASQEVAGAAMEILAQHIQGEIALIGAGAARIDVVGDALLILVNGSPAVHPSALLMLEGFIAGYVSVLSSEKFDGVSSASDNDVVHIFIGNPAAVKIVKEKLASKVSFLDAVTQLNKEVA